MNKELILTHNRTYTDHKARAFNPSMIQPILEFSNLANNQGKTKATLKALVNNLATAKSDFFNSQKTAFADAGMVLTDERIDEIVNYPEWIESAYDSLTFIDGNTKGMFADFIDIDFKSNTVTLNEPKYDAKYKDNYNVYTSTPEEVQRLKEVKALINAYIEIGVTKKNLPDSPFTKWDINGQVLSPNLSYIQSGYKGDWSTHVSHYFR